MNSDRQQCTAATTSTFELSKFYLSLTKQSDHISTTQRSDHSPRMSKIHNVFAGNPGSGKSCIANTIIGACIFQSGISLGSGLTTALNTHEHNSQLYSDTPGLDDIHMRRLAAREISAGLTNASGPACKLRLVFVVTLEDGRVRPADVVTIDSILRAIQDAGVADVGCRFSLIINKCSRAELNIIAKHPDKRDAVVRALSAGYEIDCENQVLFVPRCDECDGVDNALLTSLTSKLTHFIENCPLMEIPDNIVNVDVTDFQQRIDELVGEVSGLRAIVGDMQQNVRNQSSYDYEEDPLRRFAHSAVFALAYGILQRFVPSLRAARS